METINNSYKNYLTGLLKEYVGELKRNYNTTIDTKALDYLAEKLTIEVAKESNPKLLTTVEKNITKIFMNGKLIISSESVDNGLYENCFNISTKKDTEEKQVLLVQTDEYSYILSNNGLFKYGKDSNVYNYYTFKNNGEIERKIKVDHNTGLLISKNEVWRFNTEKERKYLEDVYKINYQDEESFNKLINLRRISTNLDITPKAYDSVMYTLSDKGKIRKHNEDSATAISHPKDNSIKLLAVADGIVGYGNGKEASSYTIAELENWFNKLSYEEITNSFSLQFGLYKTIEKINKNLWDRQEEIGTTLTCAVVTHDKTIVINIGNSRCYIMKDTNLKQITDDDTKLYKSYKEGRLTKDDLRVHPFRNIIEEGLGLSHKLWKAKPRVFDNDKYDKLLLFTNGVTDCLSDERIKLIANTSKKEKILEKIIDEAVNVEQEEPKNITLPEDFRVYPTPGKDNATGAILIKR
ncbi:MAG TPA: serine/threonine-protein phosphatase [Candidatus Onthousia excrementipullorum]|uniref:Serine/threonine-protein phosphatase n=1 Tax=Candidatus Onthousia excrementipullorum TaxID=2840884 RepID=A0A9D1DUB3_9FIRM|nr:serine/threonine-protein phosphatase [Candidatus Onthousia excrementipullorum]